MRDIHDEKKSFQEYRDQHDETIKAAPAIATALAEAKKCLADMASELQDATNATIRVNAEKDALALEVTDLRAANERLESEATTSKDLVAASAAINTRLDEEISNIHSEFEDAFSDMAKDLTMDEKFAYARDLQQQQATLAARLAVESTLYDELEETPEPAEVLSFSKITSVETPPVPAVVAKKPLGFSMISSVNTVPVAVPAALPAAAAKKSMSFSGITSVQTVPVAAPVAAPPTAETEKPKVITKII
jgi:predicted nuclease with TOPRIM domain